MEEQNQQKANSQKGSSKVWIAVVVVVLAIAGLAFAFVGKKSSPVDTTNTPEDNNTTTLPPTDTTGVTPPPVDTKKTVYKNGTYTTTGNYTSPGGAESIKVTVTLVNDKITDATVVSNAFRPNSVQFQGMFISGFKTLVVGKNIDEVQLDKVAGSSLTPKGFNDALSKIKIEARA